MKILCVADHIDPLVYSVAMKSRFSQVELVLGAGDLPLEYYSFIVSMLNVPLLFIYGNHNLAHLDTFRGHRVATDTRLLDEQFGSADAIGATFLEDRHYRHKTLLIAGLGGSMRYNDGDNQFTDFQMFLRVFFMVPRLWWNKLRHGRYLDILLTHSPPRGIHDRPDRTHTGFKAFLRFMDWFEPKYLIHGHIHLYELNEVRKSQYKRTTVLNCYDHVVLEVGDV